MVRHSGLGLAVKTRHFRRRNSCSHRRKAGSKSFEGSQEIVEFSAVCSHLRGSSTLARIVSARSLWWCFKEGRGPVQYNSFSVAVTSFFMIGGGALLSSLALS